MMLIYCDESGTHSEDWLVIGMLFVPDHASLHAGLCKVKDQNSYVNTGKTAAKYKEVHFADLKSTRDLKVGQEWIDVFLASPAVLRAVVVEWSLYQGKYFGTPFEADALKKRRAYKKWAEMLLQPEVSQFRGATFYLDRLRIVYKYDVLDHLKQRFTENYLGKQPWIKEFQAVSSWKDAHQCLQLCDLLVGCIYQKLVPSTNPVKLALVDHLYEGLKAHGVKDRSVGYWRGYSDAIMNKHFGKFSEWYWRPKKD
jgi:hypothetical protein